MQFNTAKPFRRGLAALAGIAIATTTLVACTTEPDTGDGGASTGEFEEIELRYSADFPDTAADAVALIWWFDRVEELTEGAVTFEQFYNSTLMATGENLEGIRSGRVDGSHIPVGFFPAELPLTQVSGIPFLSTNGESTARAMLDLYENNDAFRAEWEKNNLVPVVFAALGNQTVGTREEISSLDDLAGMSIRSYGPTAVALEDLDVNVVGLNAVDIYESLQNGVIDGFAGLPLANVINAYKVNEVAPHLINTRLGQFGASATLTLNADVYEALPQNVKDVFAQATEEMYTFYAELTREQEPAVCEAANEGSLFQVSDAELKSWTDQSLPGILDDYVATAVESGVAEADAEAVVEEFRVALGAHAESSSFVDLLADC